MSVSGNRILVPIISYCCYSVKHFYSILSPSMCTELTSASTPSNAIGVLLL
jgi:hypothetical protein